MPRGTIMKIRHGVLALLLSATCVNQPDEATESAKSALGVLPPTESATWSRVGFSNLPDGRYAQALAFDEARQVVVVFGGMTSSPDGSTSAQQDTWEWSPAQGAWTARTIAGAKPAARTGAAMAYDSARKIFVLFGAVPAAATTTRTPGSGIRQPACGRTRLVQALSPARAASTA